MECKEVKRKMPAFIYGDLLQHEEKILRDHIQTCHECKQMFNKFNMLKDTIKTIELNGEEDFINKTMSRINELQQKRFTYRFRNVFKNVFKKRKWIAYATTILLILIIFSYTLGFFNIFKPQEVNAQEILVKSLTALKKIKSYHMKGKYVSYVPDDFLGYKRECEIEIWFKTPDKFRETTICRNPESPWKGENVWEIIVSGGKNWYLEPDGIWYLSSDYETSCWFHDVNEKEELRKRILKLQEESKTYFIKEDNVAGRRVYVIDLIPKSDIKHTFYIDKETFFILATKNYYNDKLIRENIYDLVKYNVEIDDGIFNPPPDELVEEASSIGLDFEEVDNIYEAEKKTGYKIPIPKYIPEAYSQGIIEIGPDGYEIFTLWFGGKLVITDKKMVSYRQVFISYMVEDDIIPFRSISISYNKLGEFSDNTLNSIHMMPRERSEREELLIDKDIRAFYKPGYFNQELQFPYKSIWIYMGATMDISKDELIKIANSMLD